MKNQRPTIMEVDENAFIHNINSIQEYVGKDVKIMPVIKANGYGTFINTRMELINNFDIVAIAVAFEAVQLRKDGYKNEIFLLNQPSILEIDTIIENRVTIGVSDKDFIEEIGKTNKKIKVHIEIDSGMGRTGIQKDETEKFIKYIQKYKNIEIEGIYTHLSSADIDKDYSLMQIDNFNKAVEIAKELIPNIKYIHCSASNAILNFKQTNSNLVRPGLILYGYESEENAYSKIDIKPISKLKSKITFLKTVPANTSISYGRTYITNKECKVATIPIGYADGMRRDLSNKGYVYIKGIKAPIIGRICMDSFMIDVSEVNNPQVGDEVWIWDNENITLDEVANQCNTISYEIMSNISQRVPREFK